MLIYVACSLFYFQCYLIKTKKACTITKLISGQFELVFFRGVCESQGAFFKGIVEAFFEDFAVSLKLVFQRDVPKSVLTCSCSFYDTDL